MDWEVLEPSSAVLQTAAIPSQLPVRLHVKRWKKARKNPVSPWGNTGFANVASLVRPSVTSDVDVRGAYSRLATRYNPHIHLIVRSLLTGQNWAVLKS